MKHSNKKPSSLWFRGEIRNVRSWKDLIGELCSVINTKHKDEFSKVLELQGRTRRGTGETRKYFAKNRDQLDQPRDILNSNIFVETKIDMFGYRNEDVKAKIVDQ